MKLSRPRKPATARSEIIQAVSLCLGYLALGRWLSESGWMAVLLSPSGNPPFIAVVVALAYILLRLFVLLILPGLIVARIWSYWAARSSNEN